MPRPSSVPRPEIIAESDPSDRLYALRDMFEDHSTSDRDRSRGRSNSGSRSDVTMLSNRSEWKRQRSSRSRSAMETPAQPPVIEELPAKRPQSYRTTIEDVEEDNNDDDDEEEEEDDEEDEDEDDDDEETESATITPRHRPSTPQHKPEYGLPSKPDQNKDTTLLERRKATSPHRPDALSFLVQDSPTATHSSQWSPRSASSSTSSNPSVASTSLTTPDDNSVHGDASAAAVPADKYGTPEMTRGPARHPHIPPRELQPRIAAPGQGHAKHLPRAEKLPMSGYELLSAKLSHHNPSRRRGSRASAGELDSPDMAIKPIYRRFEALNHRLLLHLQDELSELEEQLHRLDTADTQNRRMSHCILPASRRAEFMAGGELQWHKTDVLGKIGYKLGQYNHVLTTFSDSARLPAASPLDVETYRTYLATRNPIAEIETRFLDPEADLICLARRRPAHSRGSFSSESSSEGDMVVNGVSEDNMLTPMPLKTTFGFSPSPSASSDAATSRKPSLDSVAESLDKAREAVASPAQQHEDAGAAAMHTTNATAQLAVLLAIAIVGPVVFFPIVSDFVGRMALVLVVGMTVGALRGRMVDLGTIKGEMKGEDVMVMVGVYGGVMGVVAALF